MMATRLSDSEFAARTRKANQRRAARQLERRREAGLVQMNVWVSQSTKARIEAARLGAALNETAERLLLAGLAATTTPATTTPYCCLRCDAPIPADCEDAPVCADCNRELNAIAESCNATTTPAATTRATTTRDALMMEVGKLLDEGHTGNEIARQLNASGQRTASGSAFTGQNVLRDYRAWARKNGVVSDNHTTSGA